MNLILSGGGNSEQSKAVDTLFTSLLKNNSILYIPIAMDRVKHTEEECLEWLKSNLSAYGNFNITIWNEEKIFQSNYDEILEYGGVFIGGGNTYKLLKIFKESGFDKKIKKLLKETDIPVIGGSAGAVIFAKNIDTIKTMDRNNVGLEDFSSLDMVNGRNLWVHYNTGMDMDIEEYVKASGIEVIALYEDSGIFVTENGFEAVGKIKIFK